MTYATQQNMIDRFGSDELIQLTDRGNLGVVDATAITNALADADSEINAYLVSRYTLPLASTPQVLVKFACEIARYQLYGVRASEQVLQRYKDAVVFLKSLANGTVSLGLDPVNQPVADVGGAKMVASERVFSRDKLCDYNQ